MPHHQNLDEAARAADACLAGETAAENAFATAPANVKTPLPLKFFGALCLLGGLSIVANTGFVVFEILRSLRTGNLAIGNTLVTQILIAVVSVLVFAVVVLHIVLGVRLLRNKRRAARHITEVLIACTVGVTLCLLALFGASGYLIVPAAILASQVAVLSYIDPTLSEERQLQRKLRAMETRDEAREGTLGRDETGKGYIRLDFFNLFWIFVVCCVLGIFIETVYVLVKTGAYQNRTGMLWGPFSPIYGFGAVLMTIALNRFHDRNIAVIFLVSALIGGAFEFSVSWFWETAFGIRSWDYTGTFLSIDGRTNGFYMCMWGLLGTFWIKVCLPRMLKLVNLIPWKWRYSITAVAAALMIFDAAMTLVTLDCWVERLSGVEPDNAITLFCADHYDNEWMAHHFQTMSIDPSSSVRV